MLDRQIKNRLTIEATKTSRKFVDEGSDCRTEKLSRYFLSRFIHNSTKKHTDGELFLPPCKFRLFASNMACFSFVINKSLNNSSLSELVAWIVYQGLVKRSSLISDVPLLVFLHIRRTATTITTLSFVTQS